ncbi:hypothetical protein L596_017824 [Steinernema carpocapsae]|uniref:Uncharacterized protein n=1 Tax=Steinernema carpocapsae TaxID=34508 RepID=A0A4U5N359_STECR|nr:hypothetical protein L596_017824 [Steinernema carpocapsae]
MFTKLPMLALIVVSTAAVPIVLSENVENTLTVVDESAESRFPCHKPSPDCLDVPEPIVVHEETNKHL